MKKATFCLLLAIIYSGAFAQQNQSVQKPTSEIETLKIQLQTVENEKTELTTKLLDAQTKLADANAKLINAEFGKLELELKDSNDKWLWGWTGFLGVIFAVFGVALWFVVKSLIADRVEKDLNGFKEAVGNLNEIKNQLVVLEDGYTSTVLRGFDESYFRNQDLDFKEIKALREDALLRICDDNTYLLTIRFRAAAVLADRKSPRLVSPTLKLINSVVNSDLSSDLDFELSLETQYSMARLVSFVGQIHTQESYEELKKFLISLITDNPKNKDLFLTNTAFSLGWVSLKLNISDSVSVLRLAIPHLQVSSSDLNALKKFARHFDVFNEPEGIKEILTHHAAAKIPELEDKCLELLQKHNPDYVRDWKAQKESANTQNEESE